MSILGNETLTNLKYSVAKFVGILLMFFCFTSLELSSYSLNGRVLAAFPENMLSYDQYTQKEILVLIAFPAIMLQSEN